MPQGSRLGPVDVKHLERMNSFVRPLAPVGHLYYIVLERVVVEAVYLEVGRRWMAFHIALGQRSPMGFQFQVYFPMGNYFGLVAQYLVLWKAGLIHYLTGNCLGFVGNCVDYCCLTDSTVDFDLIANSVGQLVVYSAIHVVCSSRDCIVGLVVVSGNIH